MVRVWFAAADPCCVMPQNKATFFFFCEQFTSSIPVRAKLPTLETVKGMSYEGVATRGNGAHSSGAISA